MPPFPITSKCNFHINLSLKRKSVFLTVKCSGKQHCMGSIDAGTVFELHAQATSVTQRGRSFQKGTPLQVILNQRTPYSSLNSRGTQPASSDQMLNFLSVKGKQDSPTDSRWNKNACDRDTKVLQGDRNKQSGLV